MFIIERMEPATFPNHLPEVDIAFYHIQEDHSKTEKSRPQ